MNTSKDGNRIVGWRLELEKSPFVTAIIHSPETRSATTRNHTRIKTRHLGGALPKFDSIRALLVDDSPIILKILSQILSAEDRFTVVGSATDGYQALRQTLALDPDLV